MSARPTVPPIVNQTMKSIVILFSFLTIGILAFVTRYIRDIKAARKRLASLGSQVMETKCGPIEYVRTGEGYPVLVVHGAMGGFDQGLWVANSFGLTNYQVIAVSRFGYLRSPVPPGANYNLEADIFAALLDALGIQQAAVFGISAGATAAIRFTARAPQRVSALVLIGPDAPGENYLTLPPRFVFDKLWRSDFVYWILVTFFGKWLQTKMGLAPRGYNLTPENQAMLKKFQLGDLPVSQRMDGMICECYTLDAEFKASVTPSSPYPLNQIQTPTLVLSAADDPISLPENVRALAEQMPKARIYVVPDGGHFFFGHAEEVRAEVARFLGSHVVEPQRQPVRGFDQARSEGNL
jgi:pimeloyl-ACP methyl ester carboxylesterase